MGSSSGYKTPRRESRVLFRVCKCTRNSTLPLSVSTATAAVARKDEQTGNDRTPARVEDKVNAAVISVAKPRRRPGASAIQLSRHCSPFSVSRARIGGATGQTNRPDRHRQPREWVRQRLCVFYDQIRFWRLRKRSSLVGVAGNLPLLRRLSLQSLWSLATATSS